MNAEAEIQSGSRFRFGANWTRFLAVLDEARIADAETSLRAMLAVADLRDRRFLDIGCGSGLFSLAARRLGAQVHSFDFDLQSVACAQELKRRYFPQDSAWRVEQGSVLDSQYIRQLGKFDIVYSWGVLHHTGSMWIAIEMRSVASRRRTAHYSLRSTTIKAGNRTRGGLSNSSTTGCLNCSRSPLSSACPRSHTR
jgi:2-polyprenyl-6-hydroxyphenyl methylase/3-demethylubiquinone-9 3-methyltransferase